MKGLSLSNFVFCFDVLQSTNACAHVFAVVVVVAVHPWMDGRAAIYVFLSFLRAYRFLSYRIDRRVCVRPFYTSLSQSADSRTRARDGILILFIAVWIPAIERVHRSIVGVRDGERIVTFFPASARARVMDAVRIDPLRPAFRWTRRRARWRGAFGARAQRRVLFIREKHRVRWMENSSDRSVAREGSFDRRRRVAVASRRVPTFRRSVPTRTKCREFVKISKWRFTNRRLEGWVVFVDGRPKSNTHYPSIHPSVHRQCDATTPRGRRERTNRERTPWGI